MKDNRAARTKRLGVALAVACVTALSSMPVSAATTSAPDASQVMRLVVPSEREDAPKPRSTFKSETEGSAQPTLVGSWSEGADSSNEATLTFDGGHVAGKYTKFVGTWISPAATASKAPEMNVRFDLAYSNALGKDVAIVQSARARYPGGKWGKWVSAPLKLKATESDAILDAELKVVVPLKRPARVEFQWKITGNLVAPAALHGDFALSVT